MNLIKQIKIILFINYKIKSELVDIYGSQ